MSNRETTSCTMLRELRTPWVAALGIVLYGGTAVVLGLYVLKPELHGALEPWMGFGPAVVLWGYVIFLSVRARRHRREAESSPAS